jgi:hypothetical protein
MDSMTKNKERANSDGPRAMIGRESEERVTIRRSGRLGAAGWRLVEQCANLNSMG